MGRKHSHVALECTLQSHPNMVSVCLQFLFSSTYSYQKDVYFHLTFDVYVQQVILGEEVAASKLTLFDITKQLCDAVQARAEQGQIFHVAFISC